MREAAVARLLTIAAAVDNRNLTGAQGEMAVAAWMQVLGHLPDEAYGACVDAIGEHRRTRPDDYLQPGHVLALVEATAEVTPLDAEREALRQFVTYTGVAPAEAAAHWNDPAWRAAAVDAARGEHRARAIETGEA